MITEANSETQIPGLIPSTDSNLRLKAIGQGRQDPFTGTIIRVRPVPPDPATLGSAGGSAGGSFSGAGGFGTPTQRFSVGSSAFGGSGDSVAGGASRGTTVSSSGGSVASGASRGATARSSGGTGSVGSQMTPRGASTTVNTSSKTAAKGSSGSRKTAAGNSSSGSKTATRGSTGGGAKTPQIAVGPGNLPDLTPRAPIPDPALARAVEVTGVIQIGSTYQAIVKAADEPTSRYVSVGQRLSNGRVLVKRIESNGSEPVVILEEGGVEVVRAVGAPVEGEGARPQTTAALPVPPSSI
ncbi:MAG: hypothetical protein HC857_09585 [Synechococcales cyanobacterium RU_4_20]|nr:hypothetical protein [Synechococcales cyanobacterium RU_4_20]